MKYDQGIRSLLPPVKFDDEIAAEKRSREIILKRLGVTEETRPTKMPYTLDPIIRSTDIQEILKPKAADDALTMDRKLDKYRSKPRYNSMQKNKAFMDRIKQDARGKVPRVDFKLAQAGFESSLPDNPKKQVKRKSTWDAMMESAKEEARKGNPKELQELRKIEREYHQPFESALDRVRN